MSRYVARPHNPGQSKGYEDVYVTDYVISFGQTWKDVMFLPFYRVSYYAFTLVVYSSIMLAIIVITYQPTGSIFNDYIDNINNGLDFIYLARTILALVHRLFKHHRQRRIYAPEPMPLLALDILTLLPMGPYCALHNRYNWYDPIDHRIGAFFSYVLKLPRIVRLVYFYVNITSDLALHPATLTVMSHFLLSCMLVLILSSFFFMAFYYNLESQSWADAFLDMKRHNVTYHTPLKCFLFAGGFYFKDLIFRLDDLTIYELWLAGIAMLIGFILHNVFLTAHLIAIYVQLMKFKHFFEWRLIQVGNLTKLLQFDEGLQQSINVYYRTIWRTRDGLLDKPELVKLFPLQLRSEIALDLYFDAIRHAKIFRGLNIDLSKELSRLFCTEIYIPGQLLYQKDKIKSKLVYLHSGIVEVMSTENRDSPVLSFSPGTILGEISCLLPYMCNADIRCSTTCVMHIVRHRAIQSLLSRDVSLSNAIRKIMRSRIIYAMRKQQKCKKLENPISHIYWIKDRWRQIIQHSDNKHSSMSNNMTKYYSSRYLSLLVLSSYYELKVHTICIRGKCSFVMEKSSSFRIFLERACLLFVVMHFILTFHLVFFIGKIEPEMFALLTIFDLTYLLDIYLQAITAIRTRNIFISKPSEILLYRFKSFKFLLDVFASIPYDYFAMVMGAPSFYIGLCRTPKYLKLYKILECFTSMERSLFLSSKAIKIMKSICKHLVIIAICACLAYLMTCYNNVCRATGWLETYHRRIKERYNINLTADAYSMALIYSGSVYLQLQIHHEQPENDFELLAQFFLGVCGFYLLNQTKVQLSGTVALENYPRFLYLFKLSSLNDMMQEHPEMKEFKKEMKEYVSLQWFYSKSMILSDIPTLMNHTSKFVRNRMTHDFIIYNFKKTRLFGALPDRLLDMLAKYSNLYVVPAGHCLQKQNTACSYLYIILEGYCNVVSYAADDLLRAKTHPVLYKKFDIFPIVGFFQQVDSFIHVETHTSCKVFALSYHDLKRTMMALHHDSRILSATIKDHLDAHNNFIRRIVHLPLLHYPEHPAKHESIEKFDFAEEKVEEARIYKHIFRWRRHTKNWLQRQLYLLMTRTYNPHSRGYICYELFRVLWILSDAIFMYLSFYRYIRISEFYVYVQVFSKIFWLVDFFIRAHVQYYNSLGIRITSAKYTSIYYLKRSFVIDLISNLPYDHMQLFNIFKDRNQNIVNIIFHLFTKPLCLYRPYFFATTVRQTFGVKYHNTMISISNTVIFTFVITHLSMMTLLLTCTLNDDFDWECDKDSWLRYLPNFDYWYDNEYLINRTIYEVIALSRIRAARYFTYKNFLIFFIVAVVMCMGNIIDLCTLIGYNLFSMKYLVNFQENRRMYNKFASTLRFPKYLKDELIEHYKFKFKKTQADSTDDIMNTFYPHLREQIQLAMFLPTLRSSQIFIGLPTSSFSLMMPFITEKYYKRNGIILRCNDINSQVFIVKKGSIEIFTAGCSQTVLSVGGAFGCFAINGTSRMTITAVAKVHSNCLIINTKSLYKLIKHSQLALHEMNLARYTQAEYIKAYYQYKSQDEDQMVHSCTFRNWYKYTYDNRSAGITFYRYFTNMHFAPLVSIAAMLCIVMMSGQENSEVYWAAADCYFLVDMYMSCHIQYTDNESGLCLTNVHTLTKRYLKSWKFYFDVVTILPLYAFKKHSDFAHDGIFLLNKTFRIFNMFFYYIHSVRTRFQSNHMRFTFLLYMNFFCMEAMYLMFYFVPRITLLDVKFTFHKILIGHLDVLNMMAEVGLDTHHLTSIWDLMVTQTMVNCTFFLFVWMSCGFAKLALMTNYSRMEFRRAVLTFKAYCYNEHVSKPIVDQCWNYLMYLYKNHGGVQFPRLITKAPNYIIEAHMLYMSKDIIYNHRLFKNAHSDFLRQMVRHLQYEFIMPGFTIVESGDKKMRLYFVHSGKILSISPRGDTMFYETIESGDAFGEMQAFRGFKFRKTYKALTPCQIFWIKTKDYAYLMKWFPATAKIMTRVIQKIVDEEN